MGSTGLLNEDIWHVLLPVCCMLLVPELDNPKEGYGGKGPHLLAGCHKQVDKRSIHD